MLLVLVLVMKKYLGQLNLAAQELFGKVWTVVRAVLVGADDRDVAVEAALAQRERRCVACSATAHDDDPPHSHASTSAKTLAPTSDETRDVVHPAVGVRGGPALDVDQRLAQPHADLPGLPV